MQQQGPIHATMNVLATSSTFSIWTWLLIGPHKRPNDVIPPKLHFHLSSNQVKKRDHSVDFLDNHNQDWTWAPSYYDD